MDDHLPGENAKAGVGDHGIPESSGLVVRAEQALLGAMMSDPLRQAAVLDLVRPGDMYRPYHGQVLAAMQRLRATSVAPDPVSVRAELAHDPDLPRLVALDGVLLAGLLEAAPRPGHAPTYAAMVIDHSIRRQVMLAGSRMTQAAQTGDLDAALWMTAVVGNDVDACQMRWEGLPEPMRRELPAAASGRDRPAREAVGQLRAAAREIARARHDAHVGAVDDLTKRLESIARHIAQAATESKLAGRGSLREPRPIGRAAETAGGLLLRDLAAGPAQIPMVRGWLSPGHFARPEHGHIYALIRDMHAAGQPIDPVTVSWQAARRGIAVAVAELEDGTAPFAVARAREVHRHGLLARISLAGRDAIAAAADPQVPCAKLLRDCGQRFRNLEREPGPHSGQREGFHPAAQMATPRSIHPDQVPRRSRDFPRTCGNGRTAELA